ncbi:hypothetical protein [Serinicoccus sediminis]|uniref:hypothetical protein n=1 Tax=Serinicoccus sediminis TaxID=2306021 RepID=UPI0013EAE136|nr:hypothetical protein [Serinicoccus sediminis]
MAQQKTVTDYQAEAVRLLALAGDAEHPEDQHRLKARAQQLAAQAEAEKLED